MYLFLYLALDLMILTRANSLHGPLEVVGPENLDFFGPKWHSLRSLPFQGPPLPMYLKMNLPASKSLSPAPFKQQVH
jgi:hypothetical protein